MHIRRPIAGDPAVLLDIWLRSVRATHSFVSAADIQSFQPLVRDYLASPDTDLWVLCNASAAPIGFLGMSQSKIDALFLDPAYLRRGGGRLLVEHARSLHATLSVDVNEQNADACRFYEALGFVVEGRSELDDFGRPYPLLHMRLAPG